ncbi:MAG: insulinase family protein [Candidatus Omnitrophica bacterium]|nr:insulinase family protein [Candidatus Omnitrophota bacterium]
MPTKQSPMTDSQQAAQSHKMYKKTRLNNGLTVATHQMPERASVSLGIWLRVGARYEKEDISGISHFLEHLLFKGTEKRSCEELKQSIEGIGGSLNGFTAQELTCYLARVPGKYLASALDVLGDMVLNANLAPQDIKTERKVILEEIRMYKDLPGDFVMEQLMKLLWPGQPLGRNISGEIKTIRGISREQLLAYKQGFYQPANIVVVACGDLKHRQVLEECKRCFYSSGKTQRNKFVPAGQRQTGPRLNFRVKDIKQTHLALGLYGLPRNDPARFILGLLHIILGANMSSRLFREVREERGLAYEIGTSLKFLQDTGAFIVHAGIDNRRVAEALEVILQVLGKIKKTPVEKEELMRAKEYYIGQLMLALEDTSEHMFWLGENFASLNKFLYPEEVIRRVKEIGPGDLKRMANKILQNHSLNLALIGPLKDKDKLRIKERLSF